jgi:hypothetical protein
MQAAAGAALILVAVVRMVLADLVVVGAELVFVGPQFLELPILVAVAVELHMFVAAVGIAELVVLEL